MAGPTQIAMFGAAMLAAACGGGTSASSPMPSQETARARAAIQAASAAGAAHDRQAAMHLAYAKQSAANAAKQRQLGEDESAELLTNDAKADADLSLALIEQQRARAVRQQAKSRLEGAP